MLAKSGACSFCVLGFVMVSGWFAKTPGERARPEGVERGGCGDMGEHFPVV